ncbi:MAG: tripartite tricarboxylate transporter substrate binding protein [Betaproteobacteria bacterium]|nr:tripartite tricarboxylate transporter substrate binding protein [Betaproteobacteria bacterium]
MIDTYKRWALKSVLMGAVAASSGLALAQSGAWPSQTIKIIIPFAAGGATDVLARAFTDKLSLALKQPVVVDNRPGAGSTLGAAQAAMAKPDGHTLMIMSTSHLFAPALYKDLSYDALTSFTPVTRLVGSGFVMVVHPAVPAANVREFIALAKSQPGHLNFGSSGNGGNQHLVSQMFLNATSTDVKHIPYKGSAPATTDLIGGQVQMSFMALSNAIPHVRAGKMRALAVTTTQRSAELPGIPTMVEAGVPGFAATAWLALVAPKGTPPQVVARLNAELQRIMQEPDTVKTLANAGFDVELAGPEELGAYMREESGKWLQLAKNMNLSQ